MQFDHKFSFSKRVSALESSVEAGGTELEQLKTQVQEGSGELSDSEPKRRMVSTSHEALRRQLATAAQRSASLMETRESLRKAIPSIVEEFSQYRAKYRDQTWAGAVGELLGTLTVRGGREYQQAVISRVIDVGLEIRHENGIARLQAPDLDLALQDRFQWNDEVRRARLSEEHAAREAVTRPPDVEETQDVRPEKPERPRHEETSPRAKASPDTAKTEALRGKVIAWKSRVSQLSSDLSQARSSASYGSQSSVPGSLKTWQMKVARLGTELARARAGLADAKVALAAVSPNDPLLRPAPERE